MAVFNGVFRRMTDTAVDFSMYGVRGNKGTSNKVKAQIRYNDDVTKNFAHGFANNEATQWMRSVASISDSPMGAYTHGAIARDFAAVHRNINQSRRAVQGNANTLRNQLSALPQDAKEARGLLTQQLASANREAFSLTMRQVGAGLQQAGAHTFRTAKYAVGEGSLRERAIKTAGIGGAYMGGNAALRGMTGGGMTYNNDGERDIAGIPFL